MITSYGNGLSYLVEIDGAQSFHLQGEDALAFESEWNAWGDMPENAERDEVEFMRAYFYEHSALPPTYTFW